MERPLVVARCLAGSLLERTFLERTFLVVRGMAGPFLERTQLEREVVERTFMER